MHYILRKCLHIALLSTQKYQLFLNLIIRMNDNKCRMEISMLFATYKPYVLNDWHNLLFKTVQFLFLFSFISKNFIQEILILYYEE